VIYSHHQSYYTDEIKESGMGGAYGKHVVKGIAHIDYVRKPVGKRLPVRSRRIWENNIKRHLTKVGCRLVSSDSRVDISGGLFLIR
jgi:hypothetical protein